MNYYKLITQQDIIGAITSNDFIMYSPSIDCYISATEKTGEYANYQNKLYRDSWMIPFQLSMPYTAVTIVQTSLEEYQAIVEALQTEEVIHIIEREDEQEIPIPIDPIEEISLDFIRSSKLKEMSYACRTTIEAGFDLDIHDEKHHFSLTTQDQLNLMSLNAMAQTQSLIPYHADGEQTTFYTSEEINEIVEAANSFKIYHTTYYNALKDYINSLETIEEISAITYGVEIPEEYKSNVLKILEE